MYKFITKDNISIQTNFKNREFRNEWLSINDKGIITVHGNNKGGYAWDGCTPKYIALDLIFGTPDGKIDTETNKPVTYYASLFHDVLYQFKGEIYISRHEADMLFLEILKHHEFKLKGVYYLCVRLFGGMFGRWNLSKTLQPVVKIIRYFYLD